MAPDGISLQRSSEFFTQIPYGKKPQILRQQSRSQSDLSGGELPLESCEGRALASEFTAQALRLVRASRELVAVGCSARVRGEVGEDSTFLSNSPPLSTGSRNFGCSTLEKRLSPMLKRGESPDLIALRAANRALGSS